MEEKKRFSIIRKLKFFTHAGRGVGILVKTTPNSWFHFAVFIIALAFGFYFNITNTEWMALIIVAGFVFVSEAFNTAIEIDIDLTSPEYHPYARDTKDVAAGAVLLSAITSIIVGLLIFGKYFLEFYKNLN